MKVSILDLHCLNCLTDDCENVSSIVGGVRAATHSDVNIQEVTACLDDLLTEGLVSRSTDDSGNDWFQLTARGRKELDAHWVDE